MPSLHTAYSLLTFVFAMSWRRRIGWAFIAYPLVMWFTIVSAAWGLPVGIHGNHVRRGVDS